MISANKLQISMHTAITIVQMVIAVLLIVLILIQNRGGGVSGLFGGGDMGGVYRTKRGLEKNVFILTIIFSILFIGISIANILIRG